MRKEEQKKKGEKPVPIEQSSGNVFADLGLKKPEELLAKAELVQRIADIIAERKLTQVRAAKLLGVDQPKVSALLRGKLDGFSIDRLATPPGAVPASRRRRLASKAVHTGPDDLTMEEYHADLALKYKAAANRPWVPVEADLPPTEGIRAFWIAHAAVKKAYPSLALDDYVAQVSVFDGWEGRDAPEDRTIYAVRYRRRDGRSGMNVIVDDPVEIYLHSEGPPSDPTNSR